MPQTLNQTNLPALTGIRAIAAAMVVLCHYSDAIVQLLNLPPVAKPILTSGRMGVALFFILSGFILTHTYGTQLTSWKAYRIYLAKRLARIYPLHLAVLISVIVLFTLISCFGFTPDAFSITPFLQALTLTQAWVYIGHYPWNSPAWSISAEWFAYLSLPFILALLTRTSPLYIIGWVMLPLLVLTLLMQSPLAQGDNIHIFQTALVYVESCFISGCALYILWQRQPTFKNPVAITNIGAFGLIFGILMVGTLGLSIWWLVIPMPALLIGLAYGQGFLARLLSTRTMVLWGEASYAVYLTHIPLQMILLKVLPYQPWLTQPWYIRPLPLFAYFAISLLVGYLAHRLIENPARTWLLKRL